MSQLVDIIKRNGERPSESFDHAKLHASVRAACLSVRSPEGEAETVAEYVVGLVTSWCGQKPAVTSNDVRRVTTASLEKLHPEAAYLYQNHRLVL